MSKNSKNFVPTVHQKAGEINRTNPDWRLDLIRNGVPCACCGKIEYPYVNNICDCHSHGLIERHGAKYEFQVVLEYPVSVIGFVLNELGYRVRAGEVFRPDKIAVAVKLADLDMNLEPARLEMCPKERKERLKKKSDIYRQALRILVSSL